MEREGGGKIRRKEEGETRGGGKNREREGRRGRVREKMSKKVVTLRSLKIVCVYVHVCMQLEIKPSA